MKKVFCPIVASILIVTSMNMAFGGPPRFHPRFHHYHGPHGFFSYHNYHHGTVDLAAGLILGSIAATALIPQQQPVVYQAPVVVQPQGCFESRVVSGEYQVINGRNVWVNFPYPMKREYPVSCY